MAATTEVHHAAPRCLIKLHERAHAAELDGEGIEAWLEWEIEAMRYGVPVEIGAEELAAIVETSIVVIDASEHRCGHSNAGDFRRWGRRGGLATLTRYGRGWFALLARRRWNRIPADELIACASNYASKEVRA
jgi:hypothetical protein